MSWLPRIEFCRFTHCADDSDVEGHALTLRWFDLHVEFAFGRIARTYP